MRHRDAGSCDRLGRSWKGPCLSPTTRGPLFEADIGLTLARIDERPGDLTAALRPCPFGGRHHRVDPHQGLRPAAAHLLSGHQAGLLRGLRRYPDAASRRAGGRGQDRRGPPGQRAGARPEPARHPERVRSRAPRRGRPGAGRARAPAAGRDERPRPLPLQSPRRGEARPAEAGGRAAEARGDSRRVRPGAGGAAGEQPGLCRPHPAAAAERRRDPGARSSTARHCCSNTRSAKSGASSGW